MALRTKKKKKKKGPLLQVLEYLGVSVLLFFSRITPMAVIRSLTSLLGDLFFLIVNKRREIALVNLRHALGSELSESELQSIARMSFRSFFLTFLEIFKERAVFQSDKTFDELRRTSPELDVLFQKAKEIHDKSGGCLFVTPHIGNWELLPHVSAMVGIPLVVVVRPLDNPYLERLLFQDRAESGQLIIPKKNALFVLQQTLQHGKSIGMLPDQSTMNGVSVDFFGRKATTTPVPALLSVMYNRPIVVAACCRKRDGKGFAGFVSDPIYPAPHTSEKAEIIRMTGAVNAEMEKIIRAYPEQYLWMHNRWKTYKGKKEFMSSKEQSHA